MGADEEATQHDYHRVRRRRDANSLIGAYDLLFDRNGGLGYVLEECEGHTWYRDRPYDPFGDSGSAAARCHEADLLPVLEHDLADVHRTWVLGELVRPFVSSTDITQKKL